MLGMAKIQIKLIFILLATNKQSWNSMLTYWKSWKAAFGELTTDINYII